MADRIGAVIVGGDFHGLGIARSLGRHGIPVCVVDDELSIARYSRYTTRFLAAPTLRKERPTIDFLMKAAVAHGLEGWVLFPTRDEHVAAFSRHRDELLERFRVPTPAWDSVKWAWNKWNTYSLAQQLGIPTPRTWCPKSVADLDAIDVEFPVGVKPAVKEDFFYATKAKGWRVENRQELRALVAKAFEHVGGNEVLVQEFIPGGGDSQFSSCVFFKNGHSLATMAAKRLRQHPPEFGRAATFVETIEAAKLEEPTVRFLRAMNYYGLAEVEYKYDARDGQYKLLDVNARTWGFHSLGYAANVDFPKLLFADQIGEDVAPCTGLPGVGWIRMVTDLPSSFREILSGRLSTASYFGSLKTFRAESVFSRDDPAPTLAEIALLPYLAVKKGY